ncbi:MAG: T9SS type A sorting domain-containing protein [Lewinellaceae bacterium]|nr:T9SS type A sorting domain-containing protein [Lewinellaceae bacterium]
MKQENFTLLLKALTGRVAKLSLLPAFMLFASIQLGAQNCPLGCNNNVQISMDDDCEVEVTPEMILEGEGTGCNYIVTVLGANNIPIPTSPIITGDYIGQTLTVRVSLGNNSCWGSISIEDKLPPVIDCQDDIFVGCYESVTVLPPTAHDNCDNNVTVKTLSDVVTDLGCGSQYSATRVITYQATDDSGNKSALCVRTVYYQRIGLDDIVFPANYDDVENDVLNCSNIPSWDTNNNGYPDPGETGVPETTDGYPIYPNNSYCELNATFSDQTITVCESTFKVIRTWGVLDWCTGIFKQEIQIIKVADSEGPVVTCVPDNPYAVPADPYDCTGDFTVPPPIVIYDCSSTSYIVEYLLADNNGNPPVNGIYIDDNVVNSSNGYIIKDLPLGRTWIRYTITDGCGNSTQCFTEVDVYDNVPPVPVCDEFTTVTLTTDGMAWVFAETFDDGSHDNCSDVTFEVNRMTAGCGVNTNAWGDNVKFCCQDIGKDIMVALRVTDENGNSNTCMVTVNVQDKLDPVITCPADITLDCGEDYLDLSITGTATGFDNCGAPTITHTDVVNISQCGTGTVTRTWKATDAGGRYKTCIQKITLVDSDPFNSGDIIWPDNKTLSGCMNIDSDPSVTGEPILNDDQCSLVAATYNDQVFTFVDGACFKILRTWSVIDWCTFDQTNPTGGGYYQYTQVIKLSNASAPDLVNCTNRTECGYGSCNGYIELVQLANDDCTPANLLKWSYKIDLNNDGSINKTGFTNNASGTYDVGTHKIYWEVEDLCGNVSKCEYTFTIKDCKKPTPYCLSEITTVIMPSSGEIAIWATDFDLGSSDNCPGVLRFSFSTNVNDKSRTFTCDDLGINTLEMWVTDAAGNQDFCSVKINIQANGDLCGNSRIGGSISTISDQMANDISVSLTDMDTDEEMLTETNENGKFSFSGMLANDDFEIKPAKSGDYLNGVSTLDIVLIQRHILGLANLDSPYKVIAADVNNNEKVSSADLIELRKLILGLYTELPNNESWRFADASQIFANNNNPFPFNEKISVENFTSDDMNNDFKIIKIGDVNNSVNMDNLRNSGDDTRSGKTLNLTVANKYFSAGEVVEIPITSANYNSIFGFQYNLHFNPEVLSFTDVKAGELAITNDYLGLQNADNGNIATSWSHATAQSVQSDKVLFTLVFTAKTNGTINNNLSVNSDKIVAEAYDQTLTQINVDLSVNSRNVISDYALMQNTPNPFSSMTTIEFTLPSTQNVEIKFFDITGKELKVISSEFNQGLNQISIDAEELSTDGIVYYQMSASEFTDTKKMIVMRK